MKDSYTEGVRRAIARAQVRARRRGSAVVEPTDVLAALADEPECRAAELLAACGLGSAEVWEALGTTGPGPSEDELDALRGEAVLPDSSETRHVLTDAAARAKALDRGRAIGTEHLLAALLASAGPAADRLVAAGVVLEQVVGWIVEPTETEAEPIPLPGDFAPLDLGDPARTVDLARILDASANRAREGLRVVEDYVRFVLDDVGLTRRLKEVRHRLADAIRGLDPDLLIGARDTRGDVGTHVMTHSERVRENPRAVLSANFKRAGEAVRSLEEYAKLVDVWIAGRFEVLRYDVYTLEKLVMTAVASASGLGETRLMVLVGGLPTMGDLTWIVGEALAGGADAIQLREKGLDDRDWLRRAREVRILTAQARARFVVNDRPDLARLAGADAVHLGQDDLSVRDARRIVGPRMAIGVSTHDREQLDAAVLSGASYLGVGPVFPSATKDFPDFAGLSFVRTAAESTGLPWFAIGGVNEETIDEVIEAGARRVAVSAGVVLADRPRAAAWALRARLDEVWS
ncbi:MAG: thiamine phosphate synthase [Isosphaeraceae bacterium]